MPLLLKKTGSAENNGWTKSIVNSMLYEVFLTYIRGILLKVKQLLQNIPHPLLFFFFAPTQSKFQLKFVILFVKFATFVPVITNTKPNTSNKH
jgi:hypothetical protein